jgi:hypothetical protein
MKDKRTARQMSKAAGVIAIRRHLIIINQAARQSEVKKCLKTARLLRFARNDDVSFYAC